jgi:DNA primase
MIPAQTVDLVMQTALIEEVVGDYVELKKIGQFVPWIEPIYKREDAVFLCST